MRKILKTDLRRGKFLFDCLYSILISLGPLAKNIWELTPHMACLLNDREPIFKRNSDIANLVRRLVHFMC